MMSSFTLSFLDPNLLLNHQTIFFSSFLVSFFFFYLLVYPFNACPVPCVAPQASDPSTRPRSERPMSVSIWELKGTDVSKRGKV